MADYERIPEEIADREVSRRRALVRLGLASGIAYAAPTILHLDRQAKAIILPSCRQSEPDPNCGPALP
jgi:hypothetical protein